MSDLLKEIRRLLDKPDIGIDELSNCDKKLRDEYNIITEEYRILFEKIREKIANKEMFYDHFADKSSTNKWESNYKLKLLNEKILPKFLIENKNKYIEWFSN